MKGWEDVSLVKLTSWKMPASHQKKSIFQGFQISLLYVIAKDKIVSVSVKGKVVSITGTKKVPFRNKSYEIRKAIMQWEIWHG